MGILLSTVLSQRNVFNYFVIKYVVSNSVYFLGKMSTVKCIKERGDQFLKVPFLHLFLLV